MNIELAAATAQVSRRSLYYWMSSGRLPYTKTTTGQKSRHVQIEDVLKIAKKAKQEAANGESESDV